MEDDPKPGWRKVVWLLIRIAIVGMVAYFYWKNSRELPASPPSPAGTKENSGAIISQPPRTPLPGELILKNYATPAGRPEEDLAMVAHALGNLALLVKGTDPFRLGANEEFAAALRGKNRTQLRFLPDAHKAFNDKGQLVDRWMTPLFFHALSHDRIDIRSAGPDKTMWTDDDIHRRYNGEILRGKELKESSATRSR